MVVKKSKIINILTILLYASLFMISSESFNGQLISLGAAAISILIVVISAFTTDGKIRFRFTPFHLWMIIFVAFCYCSSIWALQPSLSISKGTTILKNSICIVLIYLYYQHLDSVKDLLKIIMYGGYLLVIFSVAFFGMSSLADVVTSASRMDHSFVNQNVLGMLAAITIVINLYFILYYKEQRFLIPLMIIAVVVLAAAGSRKGIIGLVSGAVSIFLIRNYQKKDFLKSMLKISIVLMLVIMFIILISNLPMFDFVNMRLQNLINYLSGEGKLDASIRGRSSLNQLGVQLFSQHPIIGIGIDCPRIPARQQTGNDWYLHNNYLELLAGGGIIGFICFYSIYIFILARFIKYRSERTPEYDICLVLMTVQLVLQFAHVAYYSRQTYFYLMLYFIESSIIKAQSENKSRLGEIMNENE